MSTRESGVSIISAFHTLNAAFIGVMSGMLAAMVSGKQVDESVETAVSVAAGD